MNKICFNQRLLCTDSTSVEVNIINNNPSFFKKIIDKIIDINNRGYCVRRCGFYQGNYSLHTKKELVKNNEYNFHINMYISGRYTDSYEFTKEFNKVNNMMFENSIELEQFIKKDDELSKIITFGKPWMAFEGSKSECSHWIDNNQTCSFIDY